MDRILKATAALMQAGIKRVMRNEREMAELRALHRRTERELNLLIKSLRSSWNGRGRNGGNGKNRGNRSR